MPAPADAPGLTPSAAPHSATWRVPDWAAGMRFDRYLALCAGQGDPACLAGHSRARLQQLLVAGHCRLDGQTVRPATRLSPGATVQLLLPPPRPLALTPHPMPLDVLYEDADLLVVNKPAGLVVHPGSGTHAPTLVHALLAHCHDLSGINGQLRPGIVHRLDAGTTGALVVAKHDAAHLHLAAQFAARRVQKRYVAVVRGTVRAAEGVCDSLLQRHAVQRQRFCSHPTKGRQAITLYRVVSRRFGLSYVDVDLKTGRTHQIRVHMAELGHPILGDAVYGSRSRLRLAADAPDGVRACAQALQHQALHAAQLSFVHPRHGERMHLQAPLPAQWAPLAAALNAGDASQAPAEL